MELKRLRLFVILAEELHFGRAAKRAGVAQSVLSVQIQRLEDELGAPLFQRSRREVRLSELGHRFVFEARAILDRLERARRVADAMKSGKEQVLRVAMTTVAMLGRAPGIVGRFRDLNPEIEVEIRELGTTDQENALAVREIDLGFLHPPIDRTDIETLPLPPSRFLALRRETSRQKTDALPWAEVLEAPIIFYGRRRAPRLYDSFISGAHRLGVSPRIAAEARSFLSALGAASAGIGTALVPEELQRCAPDHVEAIPIEDCPMVLENGMAFRPDQGRPALEALIGFVATTIRS
ncbi:MAG: LysR substrate-binding domain-containing protein [Pseudomonadota bacterium]